MKKLLTETIAAGFHRLANEDDKFSARATRMTECGSWLGFAVGDDGSRRLRAANFCKVRLCPMCAWRRTLKIFGQVSEVCDVLDARRPDLRIIFATFTVRNPDAANLIPTLDKMFKGWNVLMQHRKIKRITHGWFRGLEITYNRKANTYHPHIHALFLVEESYFRSRDFMKSREWARLWAQSCGFETEAARSCKVEAVPAEMSDKRYKMVSELTKYSTKATDITEIKRESKRDEVLRVLAEALHRRRLCAFGGLLKQIAHELGQDQLGEGDLVHVEEEGKIRSDVLEGLQFYLWVQGIGNYVRDRGDRQR